MPQGRGRGLGGTKALAEVFTPEPEYENIWDNPLYGWSKPTDTTLRDYLMGSDYWGYKDWAPSEADLRHYQRHIPTDTPDAWPAPTKGYAERTPEHLISRRLKKQGGPADKRALDEAMRAEWEKFKPGVQAPSFSLLQKLLYMEGQGTNVPTSYTSRPGLDRFAGSQGGGGQEGGGKGGIENRSLAPSVRPGGTPPVAPVTAPVSPRPQYGGPQAAASNRWNRQTGPRQRPTINRGKPLTDIFNGSGTPMRRNRNIW